MVLLGISYGTVSSGGVVWGCGMSFGEVLSNNNVNFVSESRMERDSRVVVSRLSREQRLHILS